MCGDVCNETVELIILHSSSRSTWQGNHIPPTSYYPDSAKASAHFSTSAYEIRW